jgi:hypothetical protein
MLRRAPKSKQDDLLGRLYISDPIFPIQIDLDFQLWFDVSSGRLIVAGSMSHVTHRRRLHERQLESQKFVISVRPPRLTLQVAWRM